MFKDCKTGGEDKMAELKMNITYEKDLDDQAIRIDTELPYREDYQMKMLKNNEIGDLLKVSGTGIDGGSRYTYRTGGWISLEKQYETKDINREVILEVTEAVLSVIDTTKNYMLNPDNILISPELIFEKGGKYRFCYLPVRYMPLCESFHKLTEFFVKRLDYRDTEGIFLAYRLHKESLQEQYELKTILDDYKEEMNQRKAEMEKKEERTSEIRKGENSRDSFTENIIFSPDQEDMENFYPVGNTGNSVVPLREEYARYGPLKKVVTRFKTGIWGEWEDLITETDGQDGTTHL